ncbi:MAG: MliC family protein [Burkholderiaceae bacterium]
MAAKTSVILCSVLGLILAGCASRQVEKPLTVKAGAIVDYLCDGGDSARARYYALSDDSLHFVKVSFKDGQQYTLPNVVSASGARYSDDRELTWWIKGDSALVEARGPDGTWQTRYRACRQSTQQP